MGKCLCKSFFFLLRSFNKQLTRFEMFYTTRLFVHMILERLKPAATKLLKKKIQNHDAETYGARSKCWRSRFSPRNEKKRRLHSIPKLKYLITFFTQREKFKNVTIPEHKRRGGVK